MRIPVTILLLMIAALCCCTAAHGETPRDPQDAFWGEKQQTVGIMKISSQRFKESAPPASERQQVTWPGGSLTIEKYPAYTALFNNQKGWTGGDADYSVALTDEVTLWLFGDSFIGEIKDGKRDKSSLIVNNCMALQKGKDPAQAEMEFYCGKTREGKPAALIMPADGKGWFWIYDGIRTEKGLFLFLIQIDRDKESGLGFKAIGMSLGHVKNPDSAPEKWTVSQQKIPWCCFDAAGETFPGSAVIQEGAYIYIYGIKEIMEGKMRVKHMIIARAPTDSLADFSQWRFYDGIKWQDDFKKIAPLCDNLANEYTISYEKSLDKYIAVYTDGGGSEKINLRTSPAPEGPWSQAVTIYHCPEKQGSKNTMVYAAKGHHSLARRPGDLVISYITNSLDFADLYQDARFYFPQFLKVRLADYP